MLQKLSFLVLFVLFLTAHPLAAEVSFDARVSIQTEAENAAVAKEQAMKKAARDAFLQVAARMTTDENVKILDTLTDEQLQHFIRAVSILSEKNGTKSYTADLNITINGSLLKQYMQENDMFEVVNVSSKVLIVPLFTDTLYNSKVLWEDGNVWRQVWLDKGLIKSGSLEFSVIADNSLNKMALTADDAETFRQDTYNRLVTANGIKDICVVHAIRSGQNTLLLIIKPFNGYERKWVVTAEYGDVFEKAVAETVHEVSRLMAARQTTEGRRQGEIVLIYRYNRLKEWLSMEKRLKSVAQIKNVTTTAAGNGQMQLKISYSGSENRLVGALHNSGIFLRMENGQYFLY